jgi:hypothetical protein
VTTLVGAYLKKQQAGYMWLMPAIPATLEAEIRAWSFEASLDQKTARLHLNKLHLSIHCMVYHTCNACYAGGIVERSEFEVSPEQQCETLSEN